MEIKPLFDRVLLKPFKEENKSKLITANEKEGNKMQVIAVGTKEQFLVKPNDIVLINKYSGSEFLINNEVFVLIKETDILAVMKENNYV
jgi:chaperonin GroES